MIPRVREVGHVHLQRPRRFGIADFFVPFGPSPHVAHAHPALGRHLPVGFGEVADCSMASAVSEEFA